MISAWGMALVGQRFIVAPSGFDSAGGSLRDTWVTFEEADLIAAELESLSADRHADTPACDIALARANA